MATVVRELSRKLASPQVLIVGLGGLGCPVAELLAAGGGLRLVLSDLDHVDRSNLPRQWLYTAADIGRPKTEVAAAHLCGKYDGLHVEMAHAVWPERPDVSGYDLVLECTDNVDLKFAVSDAAMAAKVPIVVGGAVATRGFALATRPGRSPCLRCVFEGPTDDMRRTCRDAGVLAPLPAMVGAVMAAQAWRLLAGEQAGALWSVELAKQAKPRLSRWERRLDCPGCRHAD